MNFVKRLSSSHNSVCGRVANRKLSGNTVDNMEGGPPARDQPRRDRAERKRKGRIRVKKEESAVKAWADFGSDSNLLSADSWRSW